jgi:carboxymethylenebutenolidase
MLAAAAAHVDCVVSYYPVGLDGVLETLGHVEVPSVLHFAGADPFTPPAAIDAIRATLAARPDAEIYVYPDASHSFDTPGRPSYDASASGMAYTRTIALLRRVLGPHYDLSALWETHRACEFVSRDAAATMRTMVAEPYVNHVPTLTGGFGQTDLHRFYRDHFIPSNPVDMRSIPVSRTVGADRVVNEGILCFTHDCEIEWMLPGVPPTGRYVEVALVGIVTFRGDKLVHEHIYWDQASVLVQIGLLDPRGLPVAGVEAARKVLHPERPSNALMPGWARGDAAGGSA